MADLDHKPKVLTLGTMAMDIILETHMLPQDDGFSLIEGERMIPGGSCANVSVALQRMGAAVYQTGQVGDDNVGQVFAADLKANGVNTGFLKIKKGGTTLHTYIITAPGGKHCIFANMGDAVNTLKAGDLPGNILDGISCFYTDMFSPDAALRLAKEARRRGIPVVYNMQCVPSFMAACNVSREELEEMLSLCTLFVAGREAYQELTGSQDPKTALSTLSGRFKIEDGLIYTAGSEGAYWQRGSEVLYQKAFPVEVVDTTGAGDSFSAGMIFDYYLRRRTPEESLAFAGAVAAHKCTVKGPRSIADLTMIEDFIHSQQDD
jgi:sugar/nucleoside kinase (ribokinase family)